MGESEARGVFWGSIVVGAKSLVGLGVNYLAGLSFVPPVLTAVSAVGLYAESSRLQQGTKESGLGYGVATAGLFASAVLYARMGEAWSYAVAGIDGLLAGLTLVQCGVAVRSRPPVVVKKEVEPLEELINRLLGVGDALVVRKQFESARESYAEALREAQLRCNDFVCDVYAHLFCGAAAEAAFLELEGGDGGSAAKRAMEYLGKLCAEKEVRAKDGTVKKTKTGLVKKGIALKEEAMLLRTLNHAEVYERIRNFLSCYELQENWRKKYYVNPFESISSVESGT